MSIVKPEIGPGFFDDLGSEDMSVLKAFNEIIANSIDSWIQKGKTKTSRGQLVINIEHKDNAFIITDNAGGMNKQDMVNAMGFGVAQKSSSEFGDDLMGTYGFGLKAATSAIGRHFEVISKMANKKIYLLKSTQSSLLIPFRFLIRDFIRRTFLNSSITEVLSKFLEALYNLFSCYRS